MGEVKIGGGPSPIGEVNPIVSTPGGNTIIRVALDGTGDGIDVYSDAYPDSVIYLNGITDVGTDLTVSSGDPANPSPGDIVDNVIAQRQQDDAVNAQYQVYQAQALACGISAQIAQTQADSDYASMALEDFLGQGPDVIANALLGVAQPIVAAMQAQVTANLLAAGKQAEVGT